MNVGELFAGIGGFGLAAQRAGCLLAWAVEIDPFARMVYQARLGKPQGGMYDDVRTFPPSDDWWGVDCITAGFPCQDLSVAGKRGGLRGERSGLFWEVTRIAERVRPRWLLLENVPGLFSSHRGRDFESVLAALDELGYGVAWRVLDAQFFGVPQRRQRVFLVGHLGAPCPAEVLFEPEGMSGDSAPSRAAGEAVAGSLGGGAGRRGWCDDTDRATFVIQDARGVRERVQNGIGIGLPGDPCYTLDGVSRHAVAHALRAEGADASEDGTGRGTPLVTDYPKRRRDFLGYCGKCGRDVDADYCDHCGRFVQPSPHEVAPTLRVGGREQGAGSSAGNTPIVAGTVRTHRRNNSNPVTEARELVGVRPRRLTPRECERLQGFPDDWTLIAGASDSARYRALGNAVAVPVIEWIMRRLVAGQAP